MHACNASFVVIFPFKIWSHALNIGASTLSSSHNFAAAGAVATPSATPAKDAARDSKTSATDFSSDATAKPTALFRLSAPRHVSIKSPTPANPPSVVALAPNSVNQGLAESSFATVAGLAGDAPLLTPAPFAQAGKMAAYERKGNGGAPMRGVFFLEDLPRFITAVRDPSVRFRRDV